MGRRKQQVSDSHFVPQKFKTLNETQAKYVKAIETSVITFAVGPAGTAKTYVAVATACALLLANRVNKIILTRPIIECGEGLGFLPGELKDKVNPYMIPLYDVLKEFISPAEIQKYEDNNNIEVCPLAYMRGRTFNNAIVILDEAQNTNEVQLKMFLTRLGQNCRLVINGDMSQTDLFRTRSIALSKSIDKLKKLTEVSIIVFDEEDIVRNKFIQKILECLSDK